MKILFVHNWYGSSAPSGENQVVIAEIDLLRRGGYEVIEYFRYSDNIRKFGVLGKIIGGLSTPFNPFSYLSFRKFLRTNKPDIIHVHNFFPMISPSIFFAASKEKIPVVMTLHNYRIGCGAGLPFRKLEICLKCINSKSVIPLLINKCYRDSYLASVPLALMISLHRILNTWKAKVENFIVLTKFQASILSSMDLINEEQIFQKPQFMVNPPTVLSASERNDGAIFVGRISPEKGLDSLLAAWQLWGKCTKTLTIIGDGPDFAYLKSKYNNDAVRWLGQLSSTDVHKHLSRSRLLIIPSICFEGFPMVLREALAFGVPILASDIGPLPDLVNGSYGSTFKAKDVPDLFLKIKTLLCEPMDDLEKRIYNARLEFDSKYTAELNIKILLDIYKNAIFKNKYKLNQKLFVKLK